MNAATDDPDANIGDGACATESTGNCTLRAALQEAGSDPDVDRIVFSPGFAARIIPRSPLPSITQPLVIDGELQATPRPQLPATPGIVIDGSSLPASSCSGGSISIGQGVAEDDVAIQVENTRFEMYGVAIFGAPCTQLMLWNAGGSIVSRSWFGVRPGSADIADQLNGIYIKANASETLIGGNTVAEGNVVAGFSNTGILIDADSDDVDIARNFVGTIDGVTGFMAPGNTTGAEYGVFVSGEPQALNDSTPIQEVSSDDITIRDNTIGSIGGAGVSAAGNTDNLVVRANHIGAAGDSAAILPIGQSGVIVDTHGGTPVAATGARITDNVIGRSSIAGIELTGAGTTGVVVQGNSIGTEAIGPADFGNSVGVLVRDGASDNLIGVPIGDDPPPPASCGPGHACNQILNNYVAGVWIGTGEAVRPGATTPAGSGNTVRGNDIARNVGLGIDLGDLGPTANDATPTSIDVDTGPNGLVNTPVAVSGGSQGGSLTVSGMVMSEDLSGLTIDIYEYGIFQERDLDDLFGTRTLRAGARYDTDLRAWFIPAPSATSATAYPQPLRWIGTVRSADIDPARADFDSRTAPRRRAGHAPTSRSSPTRRATPRRHRRRASDPRARRTRSPSGTSTTSTRTHCATSGKPSGSMSTVTATTTGPLGAPPVAPPARTSTSRSTPSTTDRSRGRTSRRSRRTSPRCARSSMPSRTHRPDRANPARSGSISRLHLRESSATTSSPIRLATCRPSGSAPASSHRAHRSTTFDSALRRRVLRWLHGNGCRSERSDRMRVQSVRHARDVTVRPVRTQPDRRPEGFRSGAIRRRRLRRQPRELRDRQRHCVRADTGRGRYHGRTLFRPELLEERPGRHLHARTRPHARSSPWRHRR